MELILWNYWEGVRVHERQPCHWLRLGIRFDGRKDFSNGGYYRDSDVFTFGFFASGGIPAGSSNPQILYRLTRQPGHLMTLEAVASLYDPRGCPE